MLRSSESNVSTATAEAMGGWLILSFVDREIGDAVDQVGGEGEGPDRLERD